MGAVRPEYVGLPAGLAWAGRHAARVGPPGDARSPGVQGERTRVRGLVDHLTVEVYHEVRPTTSALGDAVPR